MRFLIASLLLVGCAPSGPAPVTGPGPSPPAPVAAASQPASARCESKQPAALGPARLCGRAENAKGGAVLLLDDGAVVYLLGLESWPDPLHRKRVEASGRFGRKKLFPDPAPAGAEQTQGAFGDQLVLDGANPQLAK